MLFPLLLPTVSGDPVQILTPWPEDSGEPLFECRCGSPETYLSVSLLHVMTRVQLLQLYLDEEEHLWEIDSAPHEGQSMSPLASRSHCCHFHFHLQHIYVPATGCLVQQNIEYLGISRGVVQASSPGNCCSLCTQREDCNAWTWCPEEHGCQLKDGGIQEGLGCQLMWQWSVCPAGWYKAVFDLIHLLSTQSSVLHFQQSVSRWWLSLSAATPYSLSTSAERRYDSLLKVSATDIAQHPADS